jgi:hypothetical protein
MTLTRYSMGKSWHPLHPLDLADAHEACEAYAAYTQHTVGRPCAVVVCLQSRANVSVGVGCAPIQEQGTVNNGNRRPT